jgi:hypothetical protein
MLKEMTELLDVVERGVASRTDLQGKQARHVAALITAEVVAETSAETAAKALAEALESR